MNPAWHVHNGDIPKEETIMTFSMLLNLVETSNADSKELLWKFVKRYKKILKPNGIIHLKTDNTLLYHSTLEEIEEYNKIIDTD